MAKYDQKTVPVTQSAESFLNEIEHADRRSDALKLFRLLRDATGQEPEVWKGGIIGVGRCHYTYASGHSGYTAKVGFAARKSKFTLYACFVPKPQDLQAWGKVKSGVGCIYFNKLADIDENKLKAFFSEVYQNTPDELSHKS